MLFAMWLLFSGVMRVVSSVELRALGMRRWGWVTLLGVVLLVAGFVGLMDPWLGARALGATLGVCFILEGLDSIFSGWLTAAERMSAFREVFRQPRAGGCARLSRVVLWMYKWESLPPRIFRRG